MENKQKKMSKVVHINVTEGFSTESDFEGMIPEKRMLPSRSPDNLGISPKKIHSPSLPVQVQFSASSSNGQCTKAGSVPNKIGHVSRSRDTPLSPLVHPDLQKKGAKYVKSVANSAIEIAIIKSLEDGVGPVSIVRIYFYYHVTIESNVPVSSSTAIHHIHCRVVFPCYIVYCVNNIARVVAGHITLCSSSTITTLGYHLTRKNNYFQMPSEME